MATKKELIEIAREKEIYFQEDWTKARIKAAIDSGVKLGDQVEVECHRTGLKFYVAVEDQKPKMAHSELSKYTDTNDVSRYRAAIDAIKHDTWTNWEELEAAIEHRLNPDPVTPLEGYIVKLRQASRVGRYQKPSIAKVIGQDRRHGYKRRFVHAFSTIEGGEWCFAIQDDGVYQLCDRNSNGSSIRSWLQVKDGKGVKISEEEAIAIVGEPSPTEPKERPEGCRRIIGVLGMDGEVIEYYGDAIVVVAVREEWENDYASSHLDDSDEIGLICRNVSYCRTATAEEGAEVRARIAARKARNRSSM